MMQNSRSSISAQFCTLPISSTFLVCSTASFSSLSLSLRSASSALCVSRSCFSREALLPCSCWPRDRSSRSSMLPMLATTAVRADVIAVGDWGCCWDSSWEGGGCWDWDWDWDWDGRRGGKLKKVAVVLVVVLVLTMVRLVFVPPPPVLLVVVRAAAEFEEEAWDAEAADAADIEADAEREWEWEWE